MNFRIVAVLLALLIAGKLQADDLISKQIISDIQNEEYDHLGKLLKSELGKGITYSELTALAKKEGCEPLLNAIRASRRIKKYHTSLDLKHSEVLQTALFIETTLKKHTAKRTYYLPKEKTGLAHTIEHDPHYKSSFIVFDSKKAYIGEGKAKTVHKAIHYTSHPKIVARAKQSTTRSRESSLTKMLHGKPGMFETLGFGTNTTNGKTYSTIYSKLYRPGSLQDAFDKGYKLSLREKMKVASDILKGLASMHKLGIVHRDLGARNHLIDIPKGKIGNRKVSAGIADLGRATYAHRAADTKVQGNTTYTAPEALYRENLKGKDYYKTDIFAVGCVFYRLFYDKIAPWQDMSYVKNTTTPLYYRYVTMKKRIEAATSKRRDKLSKKQRLTAKDRFELVVLQMLHTTPSKRGTAKKLSKQMNKILVAKITP